MIPFQRSRPNDVLLTLVTFVESAGHDLMRRKENNDGKQTDPAPLH